MAWVRLSSVPVPEAVDSPASHVSEGRIMQHVKALAAVPGGRGVRTQVQALRL